MKINKYVFYVLFSISVILFILSFIIFITLSLLGNTLKQPQPKLGYSLLITIFVSVILSIICHIISIPFAIKYYRYRFIELNDTKLLLFNIFYVIIAMFVIKKWINEKQELNFNQNQENK
ncbi:hypothetical protein EG856_02550 [Mycoplasmopsis phocirhinis]|uniref:Uncharacterized protein n=1 Tax=Mycoplasmopsis phocirhinis TaxID=142650 RepID=A0A4P6MSV8_9BACT|nr:hypothetical protein [Mycoplasmopsis phocirhinis]QBF34784.1 hypothetical protein EG856_02550 [Mycoplasmopsis phocirhinis]